MRLPCLSASSRSSKHTQVCSAHPALMATPACSICCCPQARVCITGQLKRAAVELAKLWRLDKYLRRLDVCNPCNLTGSFHHSPAAVLLKCFMQ